MFVTCSKIGSRPSNKWISLNAINQFIYCLEMQRKQNKNSKFRVCFRIKKQTRQHEIQSGRSQEGVFHI